MTITKEEIEYEIVKADIVLSDLQSTEDLRLMWAQRKALCELALDGIKWREYHEPLSDVEKKAIDESWEKFCGKEPHEQD